MARTGTGMHAVTASEGSIPATEFPDFFLSYMIGIEATWAGVPRAEKDARAEQTAAIEALLLSCATPLYDRDRQWRKASLLEQLIAPFLTVEQLKIEIERRLIDLERWNIATATMLRSAYVALLPDKATQANLLPLYLSILDELQWKYTKIRLDRYERFRAVKPILWYSGYALTLAIAPFVLWQPLDQFIDMTRAFPLGVGGPGVDVPLGKLNATLQALYIAISFGLLGALFSRLSSLQANFASLDHDAASSQFKQRVIWLRMIFGVFGSIILYFAIYGKLLGGDVFPDPAKLETLSYGAPDSDFAKLVIWSFLGGFSERLIPDFLQRTEAQASKT